MPQKKYGDKPSHWHPIHSAKEQKQNKAVILGFAITAALIIGLIGYAILYENVFKNNIPVANVNGNAIDNNYYKDRVRLERNSYIQQFLMLNAQTELAAGNPAVQEYFQNQLLQIQQMLDNKEAFGKIVLDKTIDDEIIAQQAESLGLEVNNADVDGVIEGLFNYFPDGTPTPEPTSAPNAAPKISRTQESILNYTPTPADDSNVTPEETADNPENQSPTATIAPEEGTPEPTATVYTEALYKANYDDYIKSMVDIGVSEENLRTYMYHYLLDKKVMDEVTKDVPRDQEQVWARHILVKTKEEAQEVLKRIEQGEDWTSVAAEVSLDTSNKDNGGDLGWFTRGKMVQPFEVAAFTLPQGKISPPIETQFGWHLIQLIGKETFPLSDTDYQAAKELKYNDWFNTIKESSEIKINDVWKDITPSEPVIPTAN